MDSIAVRLGRSPSVSHVSVSSSSSSMTTTSMRIPARKIGDRFRCGVITERGARTNAYGDPAPLFGNGVFSVGDFMTKKERLHVVKPTTLIDNAMEMLVQYGVSGFPVIDDNGKLVGVVSDYDMLALDTISGNELDETCLFPDVESSWKAFNEFQNLQTKHHGKNINDMMSDVPLSVHESSNLHDVARLLLETKYHRLPVVDDMGKLVGMITRGNVVRAALHAKRDKEMTTNA
ncbi:CBS domain-containing protein CBSX2, chloroplastic [Zostera marina]|uniref:CBS domain-containing protein CBSX2, chloroplastic n=1 Tax=Zostera marina TaxID=29655 RepID=A0A0K9PK02_ZOSMR|nr:CBS domain-containing protein CBSX2, chloroplastic [Zostera marina]